MCVLRNIVSGPLSIGFYPVTDKFWDYPKLDHVFLYDICCVIVHALYQFNSNSGEGVKTESLGPRSKVY